MIDQVTTADLDTAEGAGAEAGMIPMAEVLVLMAGVDTRHTGRNTEGKTAEGDTLKLAGKDMMVQATQTPQIHTLM